jgi:hypothetical protein
MPSPFPGMDPYLEAPDVWPDFHDQFASQISRDLNRTLPRPYYARLQMRPEVGIVGLEEARQIVPDVAIVKLRQPPIPAPEASVAVLDRPRTELSASIHLRIPNEPIRHHFVEIRDASRGHALVTLIEMASPSNKRPGPDRRAYEKKQQEILASETSLIELDLLRAGQRVTGGPAIIESARLIEPAPDYLVAISRAWQRGPDFDCELFPIRLEEPLPCIPVPLREHEAEVPLDLQFTFGQVYESGPYALGAVDYSEPPDPPVRPRLAEWLTECLERWRAV